MIAFFFANALNFYISHKYNKTERKVNRRYPSKLSSMAAITPVSPL